jgi:hypothetical protein
MRGSALSLSLRIFPGLTVAAILLLLGTGCSRKVWRQRADNDVAGVITQKNVFPQWQVQNWHVYPDPRARFADPSNPDRPPYPPDDYAARVLSPNPQHPGKKSGAGRFEGDGYVHILEQWDSENRAHDPAAPEPNKADPLVPEKVPAPKPVAADRAASAIWKPWQIAAARRSEGLMGPPMHDEMAGTMHGPTVTETRDSGLIVVSGEIRDGDKLIPALIAIPTISPDGQPKKDEEGPPAIVATGDAANDIFKVLESKQTGYRITLDQAVELAVFNSREFQNQREFLYSAALPVTLQRFNFAAQGFFTETAAFDFAGRLLGRVPQNGLTATTTPSLSKLFPTGALLAVKLANQVVVDLSNGRPTVSLSNLTLNLSQPFLRGGGYAVTLEPLTQAERTMIYAIRSYARFRKIFYVAIAGGGSYTNNPYGFPGLSVNLGRAVGNNLTAPDPGYLSVLLATAVLANQRRNVEYLEGLLKLYQAFREGGMMSDLQVAQVESNLVNSRGNLLGSNNPSTAGGVSNLNFGNVGIRTVLDAIDSFKLQLGVPMTVGVDFDQSPLGPVRSQLDRFEAVYAQVRDVETAARRYDPAEPVGQFRARWQRLLTETPLVRGTAFAKAISARWQVWQKLTADGVTRRLADLAAQRRKLLDERADRLLKNAPEPESEIQKLTRLEEEIDLGHFELAVRAYEAQPWLKETGQARATVQAAAFRDVVNSVYQLILEARNERLTAVRQLWPKLSPVMVNGANVVDGAIDDAYSSTVQTALENRLDLMSARGQVVDAWRQIKVTANALQGVLNLQYNLTSNTPAGGSNPFAFSSATTDNQVVISGELPLVRRAERNNYRLALINYQAQRRVLQAFEDNIANDVRADVRSLRTLTELYKVQQRLVELGYYQVDNAQSILLAPPAPAAPGQAAGGSDPGSQAALTTQLLQAQNNLVTAQNTLFVIWVNYIIARMDFFADTDLMQLDERGIWRDEYLPGNDNPGRAVPEQPGGERLAPPRAVPVPGQR